MLRSQDILFGILGVTLAALMAFHFGVIVLALVGAFACGSIYVFAAMIPTREESFLQRAFTSVFLAIVLSSLVLILPGTLGAPHPELEKPVIAIAGLLPLTAICFEVVRTPRVIRAIRRCLGLG
jgi:drug/metabolite transporter (DMT)-like permease